MKTKQIIGLLIGILLLFDFEPAATAMPIAAPGNARESSVSDGRIVKVVTAAGAAHRSARRTARRTVRRHTY